MYVYCIYISQFWTMITNMWLEQQVISTEDILTWIYNINIFLS